MKAFRNILVGIDFSPASRSALRAAIRLGACYDATITAVQIIDPLLATAVMRVNGFQKAQVIAAARDMLKRFLSESELGTELIQTYLEVDHPFAGLSAACLQNEADLLVMGTRGNEHSPNQVGAVATKCIRKAPADVLLVREDLSGPFIRTMVCVDFSETSAGAVEAAARVSRCDRAELDCVYVYQSPVAMAVDYGGFMPALPVNEVADMESLKADLEEFATPILAECGVAQWNTDVVESLNIRDAIVRHARQTNTDLVVLGTRGKGGVPTMLLGTTAESIIKHAACSVLAVKPERVPQPQASCCREGGNCRQGAKSTAPAAA